MTSQPLLVWMDLEMTGLDPARERIIEMATLITDHDLNIVAEGPELVVHQPDSLLNAMDDWNKKHHGASGLIDRVRASTLSEEDAEKRTLDFIKIYCRQGESPLAGNSIHQDKRFLVRYMPRITDHLHYRLVDVSTLKELAFRWYPKVMAQRPKKTSRHRALDDIKASIEELRFYRQAFFKAPADVNVDAVADT